MSDTSTTTRDLSAPVGHLSVHLGDRPGTELPFLFEQPRKERVASAAMVSLLAHVGITVLVFLIARYAPGGFTGQPMDQIPLHDIIWTNEPGPGGGGGGGGNRMQAPPRKAELPGKQKISVPVEKPPEVKPVAQVQPKDQPVPEQQLNIPAMMIGASTQTLPGTLDGVSTSSLSLGPGSGGGAGTGTGTGIGPGTGSGLGPGYGGGTGGGAYRPGSGVENPVLIREVKPQYTADAMRAKIQGTVIVQCVVLPDGTVTDVQVVKSLDPVFGLDQEAVKAAKQWRFMPGKKQGQPVPVIISIELAFTLR
ncbi:MAG TPA: TonB family protein [Vicinamibacterales bacterium]|jgi:TonB family protein